ncbi:MAG TPA: MauE/DoxX family redox-associated membrane protein [Edaphocola sp.]|nr:MauE/DoxX family redox-associated membrane protein [Edaphocola sp.]
MKKFDKKEILYYVISVLLGCFFIFSAYTKTVPIESFEFVLRSQLPINEFAAGFAARFIIGLEAALGFLLLLNFYGRSKWVISFSFWLIIALTLHLILLFLRLGNEVSCGCMGDLIPMKPLPSIAKNIVLLAVISFLWKKVSATNNKTIQWVSIGSLLLIIILPFIVFPFQKQTLALNKLYNSAPEFQPTQELRKGKHMLAFMSLTCAHCMDAALELSKMKNENGTLPIYIVFADVEPDSLKSKLFDNFIEITKFADIPHSFLNRSEFVEISGGYVPAIFWIEDGIVIRKVSGGALNQKEFENWLKH